MLNYLSVALLTYYITRLCFHISSYRDMDAFIDSQIDNFPDCFAGWTWLGLQKSNKELNYCALECYQQGLKLRPIDFRLNYNCGIILAKLGYLDAALKAFEASKLAALPQTKETELLQLIDGEINKIKKVKEKAEIVRHNKLIDEYRKTKKGAKL
jgi:tetratricopeptide (TPR) repeat protein